LSLPSTLATETPEGVLEAVAWAAAEERPVEILGHGSKRGVGRPVQAEWTLDLSRLTGVTLYEPEELVLSARAGTPMAEIEQLLAAEQAAACLRADGFRAARPAVPTAAGTIGGVLAAMRAGRGGSRPGLARDHVLGIHAGSGRGEAVKSGGRVVKNVTGYDPIQRASAGLRGARLVRTEHRRDLQGAACAGNHGNAGHFGLDDRRAVDALCDAMGTPGTYREPRMSQRSSFPPCHAGLGRERPGGDADPAGRLWAVIAYRLKKLQTIFGALGETAALDAHASELLWRALRDAEPVAAGQKPGLARQRGSEPGAGRGRKLRAEHPIRAFYDWSGGLVWIETWRPHRTAWPARSALHWRKRAAVMRR
jgi:glycolate oxidase FAD binding subunit